MIQRTITLPLLGLIAGTRAALGAGIALLLADRLTPDQRRAVGWTLTAVGVISTIPLAAHVLLASKKEPPVVSSPERERAMAAM
ncbi:MAG TPA: hypothetical protein VGP99_05495 [Tepidisphaeraceae bacterium]|jgi:hypothetical protein|nr:hypothetical protein [Tepidisphaeraceae bacterium]